jgi:hypothetical protein
MQALVAAFAHVLIKHGCDTYALARSTADLRLLVDALRETLEVLRATGFKIIPSSASMVRIIPRFVLVAALRLCFPLNSQKSALAGTVLRRLMKCASLASN